MVSPRPLLLFGGGFVLGMFVLDMFYTQGTIGRFYDYAKSVYGMRCPIDGLESNFKMLISPLVVVAFFIFLPKWLAFGAGLAIGIFVNGLSMWAKWSAGVCPQ